MSYVLLDVSSCNTMVLKIMILESHFTSSYDGWIPDVKTVIEDENEVWYS